VGTSSRVLIQGKHMRKKDLFLPPRDIAIHLIQC
jgi:hypothetical protein